MWRIVYKTERDRDSYSTLSVGPSPKDLLVLDENDATSRVGNNTELAAHELYILFVFLLNL